MNRRLSLRKQVICSLLITIVLESGCGGSTLLKSFRVALAASSPLVNSLVSAGVIPQAKATAIITDFNDGAGCGLALQQSFEAAKGLPVSQQKQAKFQASSTALSCFRVIINRQNFAASKRVQDVANIAEGILASLVIFYQPSSTESASALSEKEFERQMEAKVKELERLMKP